MNRSFDIFRQSANGVDPDRGTARADQVGARTNRSAEPPFEHGLHDHPDHPDQRDEAAWELERSSSYGRAAPYGGFIGDRERFLAERERQERARYDAQREQRMRFAEREEREAYVRRGREPHGDLRALAHGHVWRGRDEEHDFWGFDRAREEEHASLWDRVKGVFHGRGPKNYVRPDERIREDVCEHLSYHPYIDASDIEVIVRDGEVTLTGTVDARMVKRASEECCDQVRGVKDVHNHLRVRRPDPGASGG